MKAILLLAGLALASVPGSASAYDWSIQGHVTLVEPTYMPDRVAFQVDVGAAGCDAGQFLTWNAKGNTEAERIANAQAVLSVLLTAKASGDEVQLFGNSSGCTIDFMHIF